MHTIRIHKRSRSDARDAPPVVSVWVIEEHLLAAKMPNSRHHMPFHYQAIDAFRLFTDRGRPSPDLLFAAPRARDISRHADL